MTPPRANTFVTYTFFSLRNYFRKSSSARKKLCPLFVQRKEMSTTITVLPNWRVMLAFWLSVSRDSTCAVSFPTRSEFRREPGNDTVFFPATSPTKNPVVLHNGPAKEKGPWGKGDHPLATEPPHRNTPSAVMMSPLFQVSDVRQGSGAGSINGNRCYNNGRYGP